MSSAHTHICTFCQHSLLTAPLPACGYEPQQYSSPSPSQRWVKGGKPDRPGSGLRAVWSRNSRPPGTWGMAPGRGSRLQVARSLLCKRKVNWKRPSPEQRWPCAWVSRWHWVHHLCILASSEKSLIPFGLHWPQARDPWRSLLYPASLPDFPAASGLGPLPCHFHAILGCLGRNILLLSHNSGPGKANLTAPLAPQARSRLTCHIEGRRWWHLGNLPRLPHRCFFLFVNLPDTRSLQQCPEWIWVHLPPWVSTSNPFQSFTLCQASASETPKSRVGFTVLCLRLSHPLLKKWVQKAQLPGQKECHKAPGITEKKICQYLKILSQKLQ